jgi:hypothetical protein
MAQVKYIVWDTTLQKNVSPGGVSEIDSELLPITGLDSNLELYAFNEITQQQEINERLYIQQKVYTRNKTAHPLYPSMYSLDITNERLSRSVDEILNVIDNIEQTHNEVMIPANKLLKIFAKAIGLTYKISMGSSITATQQTWMENFLAKAINVIKNETNSDNLKAKVIANEDISTLIDSNWHES